MGQGGKDPGRSGARGMLEGGDEEPGLTWAGLLSAPLSTQVSGSKVALETQRHTLPAGCTYSADLKMNLAIQTSSPSLL